MESRFAITRTMYARDIFDKRTVFGEFYHLVQELRESDPEYHFQYFRMTKASFDELLGLVHDRLVHSPTHRSPISPAERLAITLRFLASPGSLGHVAINYRMHKATLSGILQETLPAIWDCLSPLVLEPPTSQQWEEIRREFCVKWNFPNSIGSIDGKHFAIRCPPNSGSIFHNYKKFYSMVLLAVVDAHYRFRLVDIGAAGHQSDGGVLRESNLGKALAANTLQIPVIAEPAPPLCLLGDEAFPLKTYLMRPFPGRGLDYRKKVFNYRLSRGRRTVENAFGILVCRWRAFLAPMQGTVEHCENMIKAGVCLHNFLTRDEAYRPPGYADSVDGQWRADILNVGVNRSLGGNSSPAVISIRYQLADHFISPRGAIPWQHDIVTRE
ncbi:putative nuclease HARBI1 [Ixodes scapularis]|uniref:putative nuclease HARBI1 n=1 Tax=Ixodes scapularis TaxID=6945 RepID=UPI001AD7CEEE|nr:putative nuclease HARBI1 [Ixodes scapularis]